jgi:hypothetical protein
MLVLFSLIFLYVPSISDSDVKRAIPCFGLWNFVGLYDIPSFTGTVKRCPKIFVPLFVAKALLGNNSVNTLKRTQP